MGEHPYFTRGVKLQVSTCLYLILLMLFCLLVFKFTYVILFVNDLYFASSYFIYILLLLTFIFCLVNRYHG